MACCQVASMAMVQSRRRGRFLIPTIKALSIATISALAMVRGQMQYNNPVICRPADGRRQGGWTPAGVVATPGQHITGRNMGALLLLLAPMGALLDMDLFPVHSLTRIMLATSPQQGPKGSLSSSNLATLASAGDFVTNAEDRD